MLDYSQWRRSPACAKLTVVDSAEHDPTAPDYDEAGVDLSLIRCMLALTPDERLRLLEERINEIMAIWEFRDTHKTA